MFSSDRSKRCCENHQPARYDDADIACLKSDIRRMADEMSRMADEISRIADKMQRNKKKTKQMSTVDRRREDDSAAKRGRASTQYYRGVERRIGRNPVPPDNDHSTEELVTAWRNYASRLRGYLHGESIERPLPPL
jgi:hypothetical protein